MCKYKTLLLANSFCRSLAAICFFLLLSGCSEEILHDLNEVNANRIWVVLSEHGISAEKVREGSTWGIAVPSSEATEALTALEKSRVLKPGPRGAAESSGGLVQSREERAHFLERSIAWNLQQTLERLPNVLEARVHLFMPPENAFRLISEKQKQSASVVLVTSKNTAIKKERIAQLVSGASGVDAAQVSVLFVEEGESYSAPSIQKNSDVSEPKSGELKPEKSSPETPAESGQGEFLDYLQGDLGLEISPKVMFGLLLVVLLLVGAYFSRKLRREQSALRSSSQAAKNGKASVLRPVSTGADAGNLPPGYQNPEETAVQFSSSSSSQKGGVV